MWERKFLGFPGAAMLLSTLLHFGNKGVFMSQVLRKSSKLGVYL